MINKIIKNHTEVTQNSTITEITPINPIAKGLKLSNCYKQRGRAQPKNQRKWRVGEPGEEGGGCDGGDQRLG